MPTGSGKSIVISKFVDKCWEHTPSLRILVVVDVLKFSIVLCLIPIGTIFFKLIHVVARIEVTRCKTVVGHKIGDVVDWIQLL